MDYHTFVGFPRILHDVMLKKNCAKIRTAHLHTCNVFRDGAGGITFFFHFFIHMYMFSLLTHMQLGLYFGGLVEISLRMNSSATHGH